MKNNAKEDPYGFAYKLGASKLRIKEILTNLKRADAIYTETTEQTLSELLKVLMPLDEHVGARDADARGPLVGIPADDFSLQELVFAIKKAKARRAPGPDLIPIDAFKGLSEQHLQVLLTLYTVCWREGVFPSIWKRASITIIRKA